MANRSQTLNKTKHVSGREGRRIQSHRVGDALVLFLSIFPDDSLLPLAVPASMDCCFAVSFAFTGHDDSLHSPMDIRYIQPPMASQ
jgi:hypothetical protein